MAKHPLIGLPATLTRGAVSQTVTIISRPISGHLTVRCADGRGLVVPMSQVQPHQIPNNGETNDHLNRSKAPLG